jgi:hypothetical protein
MAPTIWQLYIFLEKTRLLRARYLKLAAGNALALSLFNQTARTGPQRKAEGYKKNGAGNVADFWFTYDSFERLVG